MRILTRLRQRALSTSLMLAASFVLTSSALAQGVKQYTGNQTDQALKSDARVDASTFGMSLEIPLGGAPGRAGASVSSAIRYSSQQWRVKYAGGFQGNINYITHTRPTFSENAMAGWTSSLDAPWIEYSGREQPFDDNGNPLSDDPQASYNTVCYVPRIHLHLPDGSSSELRKSDTPECVPLGDPTPAFTGTFYSVDNTRMRFDADNGVLYLVDGGRYLFGAEQTVQRYNSLYVTGRWATQSIDRNGNTISYSFSSVTDTLGRSYANPLASNPSVGSQTYNVPGVGGSNLTYTLVWDNLEDVLDTGTLAYTSPIKCVSANVYQSVSPSLFTSASLTKVCAEADVFNPVVLKQVTLPNGQFYQFKYNIYGEIVKIIYPTGGYEKFLYDAVAPISYTKVPYKQANRGVVERWVSARGDGTDETHWQYSGSTLTRSVTAPNSTRTDRVLYASSSLGVGFGFENPLGGMAYEEATYNSSSQMLRRSLTEWQISGPQSGGYSEAKRDPRVIKNVNLILDTGGDALAAASTTQYDADLNPSSSSAYDYFSVNATTAQTAAVDSSAFSLAARTPVRTQETTYLVNDTAITSTIRQYYRDRQLLGLPSSSRVKNGSGTIKAQSEIKYDEAGYAPLTYGAVTGWTDPSTTVRGLPTTSRSWLNPTGTWLESHAQYDQCGSPRNSWDAKGNQSQVAYSSTYHYAYPTSTISADPDGAGALTSLTSSSVYDFTTGRVTSTVDPISVTTTFEYAASGNRLSKTVRASGTAVQNQTVVSYDDTNRIVTTTSDLTAVTDGLLKSQTLYDGLGRTTESRQYEGGTNYITTQQQYDSMGRGFKSSNPFRPWQSESAVWTTTVFDALSRVSTVTTPDSSVVSSFYSGNQVLVKNQAGKERMSQTNALGQLKELWEITSADSWTEDISFPGHSEVTKAYHTSYAYDLLDNLTTVSQGAQTRTFVYDSLKRLSSAANPESGTIYYVYDANGNLTKKTDALGVYIDYTYDGLNRSLTKNYSDATPDVAYAYDGVANSKGHLTSVSSSVSAANYTVFDVMGRATTSTQVTDSQTYSMSYGYNLAGSQTSLSYPSGRVIETKYDATGRMAGVKDQASGLYYAGGSESDTTNQMKYAPHGAVSAMKLGNGLWEHTTFSNRLQPTLIGLGTSSTDTSTLRLSYTYGTTNNNGNVLTHSYAGSGLSYTQTFEYDPLNRLTVTGEGAGSWSETNLYDRYGNRSVAGGLSISDLNNRITTAGYSYDGAGNLTNDPTQSFGFDAENKITKVNSLEVYRYDGDGNRVRKNFSGGEQVRMVYSGGQLIAEYDLTNGALKKEYVYGAKGLIATIEPSAVIKYTTADHLGSPRVVTNSSAAVVSRHDYKPFGEEVGSGIGGRTPGMGYDVADGVRQKFTSKERDIETGLDYFLARYYSSMQGRFTSPDEFSGGPDELYYFVDDASENPTFYSDLLNPQSLNKYQTSYNNPLRYVDPDGHDPCPECAAVATVGAAAELVPGGQVVGTALIVGAAAAAVGYEVYDNWDSIKNGAKKIIGSLRDPDVEGILKLEEAKREIAGRNQSKGLTEEKKKNLADAEKKGIPKDQLGPSGKPKVIVVKHPREKRAKDAARNEGQGKPAKDSHPKKGGDHYHPVNPDGNRKKGKKNVHHEFPSD
jgi:RHS repeat-associated protein